MVVLRAHEIPQIRKRRHGALIDKLPGSLEPVDRARVQTSDDLHKCLEIMQSSAFLADRGEGRLQWSGENQLMSLEVMLSKRGCHPHIGNGNEVLDDRRPATQVWLRHDGHGYPARDLQ